jgi:hypothetical protein
LVSAAGLSLSCPPLDWNHGGNANAEGVAQPVEQRTFNEKKRFDGNPQKHKKTTAFPWFSSFLAGWCKPLKAAENRS